MTAYLLLLLGIALMGAEPLIISHGLLAFAGVLLFALGLAILSGLAPPDLGMPSWMLAGAAIAGLVALLWGLAVLLAARRRMAEGGFLPGRLLPARRAVVTDWQGKAGHVRVEGESWEARAGAPLRPGQTVTVTGRRGLCLEVSADTENEGNGP